MLLMGLFFSVSSCDYLAVSDQMSGGLQNTDQIFENVAYTKRWYMPMSLQESPIIRE